MPCAAVVDRVRAVVCTMPGSAAYRDALTLALAQPGNILSVTATARWAEPVWTCCQTAGGTWQQAIPMAALVELFMVALDVLDDAEDDERTPLILALGCPRSLNASTGLLFLVALELLNLPDGAAAAARILCDAGLRACSGQHADLVPPGEWLGTLDDALAITAAKSASLAAAICRLGACCAGAEPRVQQLYERFGWFLGMAEQLANDMAALHPKAADKTDIALERSTLPLTHAALLTSSGHTEGQHVVWSDGPAHLTWVMAETYRRNALYLVPFLTSDSTGRATLVALLPHL